MYSLITLIIILACHKENAMRTKLSLPLTLLVIFLASGLTAEPLTVSTLEIQQQQSYQLERVYGGQIKHRRESVLGFETGGTLFQVHVQEGDTVEQGQLLITLDQASAAADLAAAQAATQSAQANVKAHQAQLELSGLTLTRHRELAQKGHVSTQLLDELSQQRRINEANLLLAQTQLNTQQAKQNKAQVMLEKTVLRAPYDGIIQSQLVDEGSIVNPGAAVIRIVESGQIEAIVGIPQPMAHFLDKAETVNFLVNKMSVTGRLKTVLPQVDRSTGTVTSIFTLDGDFLYAGSLTEMTMQVTVAEPGFWIPLSSLAESQRGLWSVMAVLQPDSNADGETKVESRLVEIIHRGESNIYVRGTLSSGDLIVASGTARVVPGQSVRIAGRSKNSSLKGS
jgi:RND family efflux transporter MFP subunit